MKISSKRLSLLALGSTLALSPLARADLAGDLEALHVQALALQDDLAASTLSPTEAVCGPLAQANAQAGALVEQVVALDESLTAPLQVDAAVLDALDALSTTSLDLANEALRLSLDLDSLSAATDALTVKAGLTAMLQLSDDIGTMADRIGEMADRILLMSDDIGLMADRILATQELQNQNVALTTQSLLQTQVNALAVVSVVEDASYDFTFENLIDEGNALAAQMMATVFSPWTMASKLEAIAADVRDFQVQVSAARSLVGTDAEGSTMVTSPEALAQLTSLSAMTAGLATAVQGYVVAISGLQAITSKPTLADSMQSMLQLSADIGLMANRIGEMGDQILEMSDNIGMQADQILATQAAMNMNVAAVQASVLGAQTFAVNLIVLRGL